MEHIVRSSKQLGHILQRVRKEKNITQDILGETISMRQATISKLEAGEPGTRIETLMVVLAALGLEIVIRPRTRRRILRLPVRPLKSEPMKDSEE